MTLNEIIKTDNLAPGGTIYSKWFDDVEQFKNQLLMVLTDQSIDLSIIRRDKELVEDSGFLWLGVGVPPVIGNWQTFMMKDYLGYSFRIMVKNISGVNINNLSVRMQIGG
jgi:hypothetical protein